MNPRGATLSKIKMEDWVYEGERDEAAYGGMTNVDVNYLISW